MQTYLETGQSLSVLLEQARQEGEVRIQREDGQTFVLKPESEGRSPLDVKGIDLGVSADEIVGFVHEGRKQF
ncbi:MAG: type II toxin-antitoxin system Phd/YefM family antitoxin [Armatimonadetes bacterium]|nr:type II toxin-antitoxin system Phd/YefM family antitoxin [Armatimonadota bacterium]